MWSDIRNFYEYVTSFTDFDDDLKLATLFFQLEKHKWRLMNILSNPWFQKRQTNDPKVKANEKVEIDGVELTIQEQLAAEAQILSDVFELSGMESVDLILSGESQQIHFEGLNRGLIAVICYYDAHRLLISTVRQMLKWDREDVPSKVTEWLDSSFISVQMVKTLFERLNSFTVQSEFARLQSPNVNGLGGSKHQKLLKTAIDEIRSEMIAVISLICEFPGSEAVQISNHLFQIVKTVPLEKLSAANMTAWVSLIKITSSEVLTQEFTVHDATQVLTNMIGHIRNETDWSDQAMCGTLQLACAVSLKSIASSPSDHLGIENIKVDVERVIDRSIRNMAFHYLRQGIIKSEHFRFAHQFIIIDELLKQMVSFFPAKLMEIERNSTDELNFLDDQQKDASAPTSSKPDSRNQTVSLGDKVHAELTTRDPSNNYDSALSNYENFLRCFVDLYEMQVTDYSFQRTLKTTRERELQEQIEESSMSFSTERSIELCRLLERSRLPNLHVVHSVAYLELCAAVCKNQLTAGLLFDIFSRELCGPDTYGWESLTRALKGYDRLFREQKAMSNSRFNHNQTVNMSTSYHQQSQHQSLNLSLRPGEKICIPAQELSGLVAWLRMTTKVAQFNEIAAIRFSDDPAWTMCSAVASLSTSSVPLALKAALIDLLTAVARLKGTAPRIWHVIHVNQLCYHADGGTLMGMQQELEERECIAKQYDVSLSFVKLMTTLLMHRSLPDYATPFIQFVTRSILGHFAGRSYNSVIQMWELGEWSLRATNALLEYGIVEPRSVASNDIHIAVITQCLNDTPMFRSITRVIYEDCQAHNDPHVTRQAPSSDAALIALRILSRAIVLHPALRACARVTSSDIMVASIKSLIFSPVIASSACTLLDLVFHYLHMADDYPVHSLYAARILRDVMATRGAVEAKMLEVLRTRKSAPSHVRAIRTAICSNSIQYTINDSLSKEEDTDDPHFARGETARLVLETLSEAIDGHVTRCGNRVTDTNNICYYLLAFRPSLANTKELYKADDSYTGLHYVLHIIEQFVNSKKPFNLPFSALLEPAFRLMQRLVALSCPFSQPVLCFMRSSNIIEKLTTSPFICSALTMENERDNTYAQGVFAVRRMIVGYILHFSAVEISAMLTTGHFSRPEKLYRALLESSKRVAEYTQDDIEEDVNTTLASRASGSKDHPNLLFSLLRRATVPRKNELLYPNLVHFDSVKLRELFDACLTVNIYGVAQYDILYLNRLMRREIDAVYTDSNEMRFVQEELEGVLEYCTEINASLLSESASERIVSGCTSLLNVFSVFAPVHFFSNKMQLVIFRDACYVLIEMCSGVGGASLVAACQTFHRLILTVTKLAKVEYPKLLDQRRFFVPVFKSMIELLLQPGDKCVDAKVQLYKTMRYILRTLFEKNSIDTVNEAEEWLLDGLVQPPPILSSDEIVNIVDRMGEEIARHLESNIADFPTHRKAAIVMLTSDLLHEDLKGNKKVCNHISKSGVPRILCEELLGITFDWNIVTAAKKEGRIAGVSQAEHVSNYKLFISILTCLTRYGTSESGWIVLSELAVLEILAEMPAFIEPPKELFLKPDTVKTKGTSAHSYANALDLALHFCEQMCTKTKWKKQSLKVLAFIQRIGEVFQQLMRAELDCECLETAKAIVYEISLNDEALVGIIDGDQVLRQLKQGEESKTVKSNARRKYVNVNTTFAAPRQLYSTLQPV